MGIDHLLFVLGLLLIVQQRMALIKTITSFTIAHSITLGVATLGYAHVPLPPLNAAIALSILFLGPEIIRVQKGKTSLTIQYPWLIAFGFGLLHGFGFASQEFRADVGMASSRTEAGFRGVAAAGQFHSVPLNLMYYLGIPVASLFCIGWSLSLFTLFKRTQAGQDWSGTFLVGMLVLAAALTGQCLVNGSGVTLIPLCMVMGFLRAWDLSKKQEPAEAKTGFQQEKSVDDAVSI